MNSLVLCENVSKKVGDFRLQDISFQLPKGYLLGIIGRNGCGKTTLLRCLMGMYRLNQEEEIVSTFGRDLEEAAKTGGEIYIGGIGINKDEKNYKKQYAYVSHESPFWDIYKVKEVGELFGGYYNGFTMERYLKNLERFEILPKSKLSDLSKGQRIKAQLAFALSMDVQVYIFDEPTGNLDVEFREEFYRIVRELMADGEKSVIYASHLVEELEEIADYVLWIQKEKGCGIEKYFGTLDACKEKYRMLEGSEEVLQGIAKEAIVGGRKRENHGEWLVLSEDLSEAQMAKARYADLKEIMYYEEKGAVE